MAAAGEGLIMSVAKGGWVAGGGKAGEAKAREAAMKKRTMRTGRGPAGFTLIELMVVMALMVVLAGIVVGGVTGTTDVGRDTAASADKSTIQSAVDRFYSDANPQQYPVASVTDNTLDFSASLPQDSTKSFVPVYLKEVPKSTAFFGWRVDTQSGRVYSVKLGGSAAIPVSAAALSVMAGDVASSANAIYSFDINLSKGEATTNAVKIIVPKAYSLTSPAGSVGTAIGSYSVDVFGDSDPALGWAPHSRTGEIRVLSLATSNTPERWAVWEDAGVTQTHTISVTPPTPSKSGNIIITLDRTRTPFLDSTTKTMGASAVMQFVIGNDTRKPVTNPVSAGPYTWSAYQNTALDSAGVYVVNMAGQQKVDIR